ncbi:hypothetical protein SAY86_020303 [Trapa natans]|uniref:ABC-type xenobiotic transporter n=1 Tax=Trapa natans TaxID=22666 RepID=A0AAN7LQC6_TRANT|nr:hypothetical protein SAY86_020303 [Trapa natans]
MSGGQKQRIQIARAIYQEADIYLLDDPFSAVDAHTGNQLFKDCFMRILKEKSVIFVTHQLEFLPAADLILVMREGRIAQAGTFEELMLQNIGFEKLVLQIASNYWMTCNSPTTSEEDPRLDMNFVLFGYVLLSIASSLCLFLRAFLNALVGLWTSQKLFMNMLQSIMRAPMSFFDSTPTGRILNRTSTDQSVLDLELAGKLGRCAFSIIQLMGTIAVMSHVAWEVFVIFIPVTVLCIWYQRYYIPTARELVRLSGIQKAPILHHFAESLVGATTIRAFDQEDHFINGNLELIDGHSRSWFHSISAIEWLSFRLNFLSNFVFACLLILLVSLPKGIINPNIAGLAITYGINLNVLQASVIWSI